CSSPASFICFSNLSTDAPTDLASSLTVTSAILFFPSLLRVSQRTIGGLEYPLALCTGLYLSASLQGRYRYPTSFRVTPQIRTFTDYYPMQVHQQTRARALS